MLDPAKFLTEVFAIVNKEKNKSEKVVNSHFSGISQTADEIIVHIEIPGIQSQQDIHISAGLTKLTIKGVRRKIFNSPANSTPGLNSEQFEKTISLPVPVRPETASARYSKGILEISLKKIPDKIWDKVFVVFSL